MLHPEEIGDLADHLRREGYRPSLYQVLAAQETVREESQRAVALGSLVRLTTLLRPIFCSTPEEQERFEKIYLEWLRARSGRPQTISKSLPPPSDTGATPTHWRLKFAAAGLLVLPALTSWFLWQDLRPREAVGRVMADNQPVAQATVQLGEQTVTTDAQGTFKVAFKNDDMPLHLHIKTKQYLSSQSLAGQTIKASRKLFYLYPIDLDTQFPIGDVQLAREAPLPIPPPVSEVTALQPSPPTISLEKTPSRRPPIPPWWARLSYPTALAVLAPGLVVLVWLLYRFSRRAVLKRQSSLIPPQLKQIQIQAGTQRIFPSLSLRHVTQRLRQTRFEESTELDVRSTIHRTMNRGGLFTPVFGSKREPGYVALIDRATVADHQANVAAQLVKDLAKGYVLVRQYEFDEQPIMLRRVDPLRGEPKHGMGAAAVAAMIEFMELGEVTAKFPTSRLLCFVDPMTCFDPLTGKIRPWVETLEAWEERFLFTTRTYGRWGHAERILSRRGFQVIPLSLLGLRLFSQLLEQGSPPVAATKVASRERGSLEDRTAQRWLERHPPSQDTIARLMNDIRKELGPDGIRWLAACAAYPEIHWALTLEWGVRLFGHGPTAEALLPKLMPLIWFRQAFMPDWFRHALYDQLTGQEADRISQELGEIISALNPERTTTLQLHIALQPGAKQQSADAGGGSRAWFQNLRRRLAIQEMGQAAEPGSPMRDYVMLQYLSGKQGKSLTANVPKALLTLLFPKGRPWLGFRPLFLVMAACLVSTGLWWSEDPAPVPLPSPIADVGFLSETNEVFLKRENGRVERWGQKGQELVLLESGEEGAFADRVLKVNMGQLRVADLTKEFELAYQKEGLLRVTAHEDGRELAREPAPAAQVASLHWPAGFDAFLVVAHADVPDLVKVNGLESLRQREVARKTDEQASAEAKAREAEARAKVKEAKIAEAKRQAELAAKKKAAGDALQAADEKKRQQSKETTSAEKSAPSMDIKQSGVREPELFRSAQQQPEPNIHEQSQSQQLAMKQPLQEQPVGKLLSTITGKDGAPMVLIPPGNFLMGSTEDEVDRAIRSCVNELKKDQQTCDGLYKPELPQHQVRIDEFYLDQYEVTNRLFQQFVQQTGHQTTAEQKGSAMSFSEGKVWKEVNGATWRQPEGSEIVFASGRAEHPVVSVSWDDAQAYCRWAGKQLPTEAQFEYATRAGTTTGYWWGQGHPGARRVENLADESARDFLGGIITGYDDGARRTAPVGSYEANPWGLYDITGNVAEWTADWYDANYYSKSPVRNPTGPSNGQYRVLRGGAWSTVLVYLRSAYRLWSTPTHRKSNIGFRCAQDVPK
ncbi:MAG: formylglycine-generating enzyme family protein [Nitrospira sp.]